MSPTAAGRGKGDSKSSHPPKNKSKWREKHQEFLRAIRAARGAPSEYGGGGGGGAGREGEGTVRACVISFLVCFSVYL